MIILPRENTSADEDVNYWLSFADLMGGVVLIFILILFFSLYELQKQISEFERKSREHDELKSNVVGRAEEMLSIRPLIFQRIQERLGNDYEIDSKGALKFVDDATSRPSVMFDEASSRLSPYGQSQLRKAIPLYFVAVFGDPEISKHVEAVVFEGHTNSNFRGVGDADSAYLFNLDLSQRRAHAAMEFVLKERYGEEYGIRERLAASGFSSAKLVYTSDGVEDENRSRRIEVRFRLKDEEMINDLRKVFEGSKQ